MKQFYILSIYFSLIVFLISPNICAQSLTALDELHFVSDIDNSLPATSSNTYSNDEAIINIDISTNTAISTSELGTLASAGIDGFHRTGDGCGDSLYSIDTTTIISSSVMVPADVFTNAGVKILDASAVGMPPGINVNAVSRDPANCDLVISIDSTTLLNGTVYKFDDLIRWNSSDGFTLFQSMGYKSNIDALHILPANRMLISLEVDSVLSNISVKDAEIIEVGIGSEFQILALSPVSLDASWQSVNLNALWALPTPVIDFMFSDGFENP